MSLNFKEILSTDSGTIRLDKINYNFDQLVANGLGSQGNRGTQGSAGAVGPQGATGPTGPDGPVGLIGNTGSSTLTWNSTVAAMTPSTGLQSDFFMGSLNGGTESPLIRIGYYTTPANSDDSQLIVNRIPADGYVDNIRLTETSSSGHYFMTQSQVHTPWAPSVLKPAGSYVENGGYVYYTINGGTNGTVPPVHLKNSVSDGGVQWIYVSRHRGFETGFSVGSNNKIDIKFDAIEAWGSTNVLEMDGTSEQIFLNTTDITFDSDAHLADDTTIENKAGITIGQVAAALGTTGEMSWVNPASIGKPPPIGTIVPILTEVFESVNGQTHRGQTSIDVTTTSPIASGDYFWHEEEVSESGVEIITITSGGTLYNTIPSVTFTSPTGNVFTSWVISNAYSIGNEVLSSNGVIYECTVAGTSGAASTDRPTHLNGTALDSNSTTPAGALEWTYKGILSTGTAVVSNGAVSSITIVNMGSNYTTAPVITIANLGGVTATAVSTIPLNGELLKIKTGRGKLGNGYEGWYLCNGMIWKNSTVSYQTEDLCSFGINVAAGDNGQTAGTIFSPDTFILGGSQSHATAIHDGVAFDINLSTVTTDLKTGISNDTNLANGLNSGTAPPHRHEHAKIYKATYLVYLEATDLYYQVDNGTTYLQWITGTAYAPGSYVTNAGNTYYTTLGGTSGVTTPVHLSATSSDGGVIWSFIPAVNGANSVTIANTPTTFNLIRSSSFVGMINGNGGGNIVQTSTVYQDCTNKGVLDFTRPLYSSLNMADWTNFADSGYYTFKPTNTWVASRQYNVGDFVTSNHYRYRCVVAGISGPNLTDVPNAVGFGYEYQDTNSPTNPDLRWEFMETSGQGVEEYGYWDGVIGKWTDTGYAPNYEEFSTSMAAEFGQNTHSAICSLGSWSAGVPIWQDTSGRNRQIKITTIQDGGSGYNSNSAGTGLNLLQIGKKWITGTEYKQWEEVFHGANLYIRVGSENAWTTSVIYPAGSYVSHGENTYHTVAGGTAGIAAPVHFTGSVSDGAVTWTYFATVSGATAPTSTVLGNVHYDGKLFWQNIGVRAICNVETNAIGRIIDIVITTFGSGYGKHPKIYDATNAGANVAPPTGTFYAYAETLDIIRKIWIGDQSNGYNGILSNPVAPWIAFFNIIKSQDGYIGIWGGQGPDFLHPNTYDTLLNGVVTDNTPCDTPNAGLAVGSQQGTNVNSYNGDPTTAHTRQPPTAVNDRDVWLTCAAGRCATPMGWSEGFYTYHADYSTWQQRACEGAERDDTFADFLAWVHKYGIGLIGGYTEGTACVGLSGIDAGYGDDYGPCLTNLILDLYVDGEPKHVNYVHQFSSTFNLWDAIYRDPQATLFAPTGWYQQTPKVTPYNGQASTTPTQNTGVSQNSLAGYTSKIRKWDAELGKWIGKLFDLKDCLPSITFDSAFPTPCNEAVGSATGQTASMSFMAITAYVKYDTTPSTSVAQQQTWAAGNLHILEDTTSYYSSPLTLEPTTWSRHLWDKTSGSTTALGGYNFSREASSFNWRLWDSTSTADNDSFTGPQWRGLQYGCYRHNLNLSQNNGWEPWLVGSFAGRSGITQLQTNNVDPLACITGGGWATSATLLYQRADVNQFGTNWTIQTGNDTLEPGTLNFCNVAGSQNGLLGNWSYHSNNHPGPSGYASLGDESPAPENFYIMPNSSTDFDENNDYWGHWDGNAWVALGRCSAPGCTIEGTLITMADGTQVPVQDLSIGDELKTMTNKNIPQSDDMASLYGFKYYTLDYLAFDYVTTKVVTNTIYTVSKVYHLEFTGGFKYTASWDHTNMLKRNGTWMFRQSMFLMLGDIMLDSTGIERTLLKCELEKGTFTTYHLDVEDNDMYIANDILTHNLGIGK